MALETWNIDPTHSSITFTIRHLVIAKVHGRFGKWTGSLALDTEQPERSALEARIDVASIDTNEPARDTHLRSADFFDVERFPEITFTTTRVEPGAGGRSRIVGDLTIRGIAKEVVLEAEQSGVITDPWGNTRTGFEVKTSVERKDFGMTLNQALETGGLMLAERVDIAIEVEAVKPALAVAS